MTQVSLSFQYQGTSNGYFTSYAGLPLFLEMANVSGLSDTIGQKLQIKTQGWADTQIILSLLLLNFAGGDCVEDMNKLESDAGLRDLLLQNECRGMRRKERRAYVSRFRKKKERAFPSSSVFRRYLEAFHNAPEETKRLEGAAFIPESNDALKALARINQKLVDYLQCRNPCEVATLDQDATLVETNKRKAFFATRSSEHTNPLTLIGLNRESFFTSSFEMVT